MKKGATLMADPINELTNQIYKNIALRILNRKEQLKKKEQILQMIILSACFRM